MRKTLLSALILCATTQATAQNPIISDLFTADPTARVFNDKVYLYPSHDIVPPAVTPDGSNANIRKDWFCMADYHVFSSADLTHWTDHGVIVTQEQVPWGNPAGYSMWAPDCVCKDGRYYFYFPNEPKEGRGFAIGVATADKPEGPFTCEQQPIKGVMGIDPCVLIDDDGQAYIYWSGMGIRGARLKPNMKELDGELTEMKFPRRPDSDANTPEIPPMLVGGQAMEGLPEGFKEGPFAFKRNGWYYLTFPWVRVDNGTETLAYAMSKSPLGPWDFKGIFMAEHPNGCWTNHHSFVEYHDQWYLFYHTNYYSPSDDKRRSVCIEKVSFNPDGTIQEVKESMRGVGITQASERIEIDRFSSAGADVTTTYNDTLQPQRGSCASLPAKGSWLHYGDVDFASISDGYLVVCAKANQNTEFFVREKNAKGRIIAKVKVTVITERGPFRRDQSGQWLTLSVPMEYIPNGITDVVLTCEGEGVSIDWLQFKNRPDYFSPVTTATSSPDNEGFIRRWMLLEPVNKPTNSNLTLTYDYLENNLTPPTALLPKDGQSMKIGKQTLKWRAVESNSYNVKLFHFAEKWGQQTYNSLFWGVTAIDCPDELTNIRLATGSNGASVWWLNDERVLTLESDRRMVQDDGMSQRLTLHKGRNILRCAVVNGPGLSDMCVRFLDENMKPVTNLTIKTK